MVDLAIVDSSECECIPNLGTRRQFGRPRGHWTGRWVTPDCHCARVNSRSSISALAVSSIVAKYLYYRISTRTLFRVIMHRIQCRGTFALRAFPFPFPTGIRSGDGDGDGTSLPPRGMTWEMPAGEIPESAMPYTTATTILLLSDCYLGLVRLRRKVQPAITRILPNRVSREFVACRGGGD